MVDSRSTSELNIPKHDNGRSSPINLDKTTTRAYNMTSSQSSPQSYTSKQDDIYSSVINLDHPTSSNSFISTLPETQLVTTRNGEGNTEDPDGDICCFTKMPVEIISSILEYLGGDDLGSSRLVNKLFAAIGRRLLCKTVYVMESFESFERLRVISSQNEEITRSVRHLKYIPFQIDFKPLSASKQELSLYRPQTVKYRATPRLSPDDSQEIASLHKSGGGFWTSKRISLLKDKPTSGVYLEEIFKIIRPDSISISNYVGRSSVVYECFKYNHKLYKQLQKRKVPRPVFDLTETFVMILLAAGATDLKLRKLIASCCFTFVWHPQFSELFKAIENLEVLDLSVYLTFMCDQFKFESLGSIDDAKIRLVQFLQATKALRKLKFRFHVFDDYPTLFMGNLYWPRLVSLAVHNTYLQVRDFVDLVLAHSKTLQDLTLDSVTLIDGDYWNRVFELILPNIQDKTLNLESFQILGSLWHKNTVAWGGSPCSSGYRWPEFHWKAKLSDQVLSTVLGDYIDEWKAWTELHNENVDEEDVDEENVDEENIDEELAD